MSQTTTRPERAATHLADPILAHAGKEFVTLRADETVDQALEGLRSRNLAERIVYF